MSSATFVLAVIGPAAPAVRAAPASVYVAPTGADSNTGTADRPFRTIGRAAQAAGPGTTVSVAEGTYGDAVVSSVSGTAAAHVRFVSASRWGAKLQTSGAYRAWLNYGSYVDIEGFDISAPDAHLGIQNEGSNVRIIGNHLHDVAAGITANACDSNGGAGIVNSNYAASSNEIIGNLVHDIGNYKNPIVPSSCWTVQGIYDSTYGGKIVNNIVYKNEAFGLNLWHASNATTVANNISFNNGVGGLQVGAGDAPGGVTADNYVISNNIIMDNPRFGIRAAGSMGSNNRYLNNVIYRNGATFTNISGGISGTLTVDPQFVNYQLGGFAAGGDYHLLPTSPALDGGVSAGAPATDFSGTSRPQGGTHDIGAYEQASTSAPPPRQQRSTIFGPTATPRVTASGAGQVVELGLKFRAATVGSITGIRFYKSALNTGVHTGSLWSSTGQPLAQATFTSESASGWQEVSFGTPVQIAANRTYVASYHTNTGNYAYDQGFFANAPTTNGPLTALRSGTDGPNGVYVYGASAFPNSSWSATNYWVDVVFTP